MYPGVCRSILTFTGFCTLTLCMALAAGNVLAGSAPAVAPMTALKWRSIGPYIGGRVVAVAGVPGARDLFYMGAVDGGVWRSTDYGVEMGQSHRRHCRAPATASARSRWRPRTPR